MAGETTKTPTPRLDALEEALLGLLDTVSKLTDRIKLIEQAITKGIPAASGKDEKSKTKFGGKTGRKAVLDKKTNTIYPSLGAAARALASEFPEIEQSSFAWYKIQASDKERFEVLEENDPRGVKVQEEADKKQAEETAKYVAEENAKFEAVRKAQEEADKKPQDEAGKKPQDSDQKLQDNTQKSSHGAGNKKK